MTAAQVDLLKRCIRNHQTAFDYEEVGWINGVDKRTADSLVRAGLLEYFTRDNPSITYVRLARPEETTTE